jgi:hypothetical protein
MEGKYKHVGYEDVAALPRLRVYTLAMWQAKEPLTTYELHNSILLVTYNDGRVITMEPAWNEGLAL